MSQTDSLHHRLPPRLVSRSVRRWLHGSVLAGLLIHTAGALSETTLYTNLEQWQADAGPTVVFETTATAIGTANEVTGVPGENTALGGTLTFDAAATGLSRSFQLRAIGASFTFDDDEGAGDLRDFDNALSVGDIDNEEDDDWSFSVSGGRPLRAIGFVLRDSNGAVGETITLLDAAGAVLDVVDTGGIADGNSFVGIVTDLEFVELRYDEDSGGDDIAIADFRLPVAGPEWLTVGSMSAPRRLHTLTLLQNGKVLAVGGVGTNGGKRTAELFDPATGRWTPTGSLATRRYFHTASLMRDGRVLVVGGTSGAAVNDAVTTAEIYDPATGTWSDAGRLVAARLKHTATLLTDGRLLVVAGDASPGTAEIYDPATGLWRAAPDLNVERTLQQAVRLEDGSVLVIGGTNTSEIPTSTERYDPASDAWRLTGDMVAGRIFHTAVGLPTGDVIAAGWDTVVRAERYDSAGGTWTPTADMQVARIEFATAVLPDGRVIAIGGRDSLGGVAGLATTSTEIYDPSADTWRSAAPLPQPMKSTEAVVLPGGHVLVAGGENRDGDNLASTFLYDLGPGDWTIADGPSDPPGDGHTATLLPDGRVLVTGGEDPVAGGSVAPTSRLFDPSTATWSLTGSPASARREHTATLLADGRVLVTGGDEDFQVGNGAEVYSPVTGLWTSVGGMARERRRHAAALLGDGRVMVSGGAAPIDASAELFDPQIGRWRDLAPMRQARTAHSMTLLRDGRVLVAGGYADTVLAAAEIFDPVSGAWSSTGAMNLARFSHDATLLPDGRVLVSGGVAGSLASATAEIFDPATGRWALAGTMTGPRSDHAAALLPDGRVLAIDRDSAAADLYDPASDGWTPVTIPGAGFTAQTLTGLVDGRVMVTGTAGEVRLYDPLRGALAAWQPVIASAPAVVSSGRPVSIAGVRFDGGSTVAGSGRTGHAGNYPLALVQRLDNGDARFLALDPASGWSGERFDALPVAGFQSGPALLTVYVNGVREASRYLVVDSDRDGDGVSDTSDNCPAVANADQLNTDGDSEGDRCDSDDDNDGMTDSYELANGFDPLDPDDAGGDADLDGETNLAETILGSDPRDPNDNRRTRGAVLNALFEILFD